MDIWTVLKACARRWYVFVPVLALTLGFAYVQMKAVPPAYLAMSTATLTGPALVAGQEPGEIVEVNPFESLGGALNQTTKVVISLMDSPGKRTEYFTEGVTESYEVLQDDAVIYFSVVGDDPDETVASANRLVELLDVEIARLQGRALEAPESRIRAVPIALPLTAEEDPVAGIRVFAMIAALGLIGSVAAALVTDAVLQSRRRRASHADDAHAGASATVFHPDDLHDDDLHDVTDAPGRHTSDAGDVLSAVRAGHGPDA